MRKICAGFYIRPHIVIGDSKESKYTDLVCVIKNIVPGIDLGIQKQGLVIATFEIDQIPQYKEATVSNILKSEASAYILDFFNAFSFAFYDANLKYYNGAFQSISQEIVLDDLYLWQINDEQTITEINNIQPGPVETGRYFTFDEGVMKLQKTIGKLSESDINFRFNCNTTLFVDFFEKRFLFKELRKKIGLTNRGIVAMGRASFDSSLINFWTVIEALLKEIWEDYLITKQVTKERKEFLTGRDLTASIMSENLNLHELINTELYEKIKQTRKARNKLMHELAYVSPLILNNAYHAIEELINIKYSIKINKRNIFLWVI